MTTADSDACRILEQVREASRVAQAGDTESALALLRSAEQAVDKLPTDAEAAAVLVPVAFAALRLGALQETESALLRVLEMPPDVRNDFLLPATLALGQVYQSTGRIAEAVARLQEAAPLAEAAGATNLHATALRKLGECQTMLGDFNDARATLTKALALAVMLADTDDQLNLLLTLGFCQAKLDDPDGARRCYQAALRLAEDRGDVPTIAKTTLDLGWSCALLGDYRRALEHFRRARSLLAQCDGVEEALARADASIVKAAASIGDELARFVSQSIAERLVVEGDTAQRPQPAVREWEGNLEEDVLCGMLSLADDRPELAPLLSHITFAERPGISTANLLATVGALTRSMYDAHSRDPRDVFEAARYIAQIDRGVRASRLLTRIREGAPGPDISGTGNGGYLLYLRSFRASPMLPTYHVPPWGDVDLEDIIASKLDLGPWPLIGLGNPDVHAFGAGKIQTQDATWQRDLTALGTHADLIVVAPCATDGTCWEIEWIVIQKFLKKTVFVMPPSTGERRTWWTGNWAALRRWSRYLGLAFPDYSADGLFFALGPEQSIATRDFTSVLNGSPLWQTLLLEVLGQFQPSSEWITGLRDVIPHVLNKSEAERRGVSIETVAEEQVETHVERITQRIGTLAPHLVETVSPYLLGLLERGLPPRGEFAQWPPEPGSLPSAGGVYTIWEGPHELVFVGAAEDLYGALDRHAEGNVEDSSFAAAVFEKEILPTLSDDLRLDVQNGALRADKMTRFRVRRNFRYRLLPMGIDEARMYADVITRGALDAGPPRLGAESPQN